MGTRSRTSRPAAAALTGLLPRRLTSEEHIARAREIRASLSGRKFAPAEIDRLKREGRPFSVR
jgi:hypothetical protein